MEGEAQRRSGRAHDDQADQDNSAGTETVEKMPQKRLGNPVDQPSDGSHHRNCRSAPLELFTHWDDENAKAIACARGNESDEHRRGQDVPSIVDPGRFWLAFRHIPLILQRQTAEYGI